MFSLRIDIPLSSVVDDGTFSPTCEASGVGLWEGSATDYAARRQARIQLYRPLASLVDDVGADEGEGPPSMNVSDRTVLMGRHSPHSPPTQGGGWVAQAEAAARREILADVDAAAMEILRAAWTAEDQIRVADEQDIARYWIERDEEVDRKAIAKHPEWGQALVVNGAKMQLCEAVEREEIEMEWWLDVRRFRGVRGMAAEPSPRAPMPPSAGGSRSSYARQLQQFSHTYGGDARAAAVALRDLELTERHSIDVARGRYVTSLEAALRHYARACRLPLPRWAALGREESERRVAMEGQWKLGMLDICEALESLLRFSLQQQQWVALPNTTEHGGTNVHVTVLQLAEAQMVQRIRFNRDEARARAADVELVESTHWRRIMRDHEDGILRAVPFQKAFQKMESRRKQVLLGTTAHKRLLVHPEAAGRVAIQVEEDDAFTALRSEEVRKFLRTRKEMMLNSDVLSLLTNGQVH